MILLSKLLLAMAKWHVSTGSYLSPTNEFRSEQLLVYTLVVSLLVILSHVVKVGSTASSAFRSQVASLVEAMTLAAVGVPVQLVSL